MEAEWAEEEEDVLWRRTKLGLRLDRRETTVLDQFMAELKGRRHPAAAQ